MLKKIIYQIAIFSLIISFFPLLSFEAEEAPLASHIDGQVLIKLKSSEKIYKLNTEDEITEFITENSQNDAIEFIEPNYTYKSVSTPNDMFYPQQFYLSNSHFTSAWNYTTGNRDVVIAVLDTGVSIDHPDLKGNIWHNWNETPDNGIDDDLNGFVDDMDGWDFTEDSNDPLPKFNEDYTFLGMNHGTIVSGVAAASGNNHIGIAGVAWNAKIMPLRVLLGDGTGNTYDVSRAIDYARENGADIINLSFVGDGESNTLKRAIARAYQAGVVIVAAAGNEELSGVDMTNDPKYPVCHDGGKGNNWVIGVGSVSASDVLSYFSNYGNCVDVYTNGENIFSTMFTSTEQSGFSQEYGGGWAGTSVSAPQVTGLAALIKSIKPTLSSVEIRDLILNSSNNIDKNNRAYIGKLGYGKVNASKALYQARNIVSQEEIITDKLVVSPGVGGGPHIRIFEDGEEFSSFFAYDKEKRLGATASSVDFDNDGREEIITGVNKGEEPWVKIFDVKGNLKSQFLAFNPNYTGGINVDAGDVNGDGLKEIVVAEAGGKGSAVRIFTQTGELLKEIQVFGIFHETGVELAVGDVNNDGFDDIVVASGPGGQSLVRVINYESQILSQFIAYDPGYLHGVKLAIGDLDMDGINEIITGTGKGATPHIRIFASTGKPKAQFFAFGEGYYNGVTVASGDLDGNGRDEIIVGAGPGYQPKVVVYDMSGLKLNSFIVYHPDFRGGVNVSAGK